MSQLTSRLFGVHAEALALRQQRLSLIASNLANAGTPGYRAQDLDFAGALRAVSVGQANAGSLAVAPGHIALAPDSTNSGHFYRSELQPSLDHNSVDEEQEKARFAQAALEYRVSLRFLENHTRALMTAITGE
jgi:flagellar basal-body rod protein FlgB